MILENVLSAYGTVLLSTYVFLPFVAFPIDELAAILTAVVCFTYGIASAILSQMIFKARPAFEMPITVMTVNPLMLNSVRLEAKFARVCAAVFYFCVIAFQT